MGLSTLTPGAEPLQRNYPPVCGLSSLWWGTGLFRPLLPVSCSSFFMSLAVDFFLVGAGLFRGWL